MPLSLLPPTIAEIVREGWGTRARFQETHELSMGPEDFERGTLILLGMQKRMIRAWARAAVAFIEEKEAVMYGLPVWDPTEDDVDVLSPQDGAGNADTAFDDDADDGDGDYLDDAAEYDDTRSAYASSQWPTAGDLYGDTHWQDRVDDGADSVYYKDVETEEDRHARLYWEAREGVPKPVYECEVCGDASAT